MKTMILNGSPRKNGDTAALIAQMKEALLGEVTMVAAFRDNIAPCIDCRYCVKHDGCAVKDGMQPVYDMLRDYDNLVVAAPVHFSELPAPVLAFASRLQRYWSAKHFRKETPDLSAKNGVLLLVGGGGGGPQKAISSAKAIFKMTNTSPVAEVASLDTDNVPAAKDEKALAEVRAAAELLNRLYAEKTGKG